MGASSQTCPYVIFSCLAPAAFWSPSTLSANFSSTSYHLSSIPVIQLCFIINATLCSLYSMLIVDTLHRSGGPMSPNYIVTLLEYCLITGIDWWDVLLGVRSALIEPVCERLSYTFSQQPQSLQVFWHNKFMALKCSLYRYARPPFSSASLKNIRQLSRLGPSHVMYVNRYL